MAIVNLKKIYKYLWIYINKISVTDIFVYNNGKFGKNITIIITLKGKRIMKQESTSKKLPGFYIALCCCVIAIGAAGYLLQQDEITTDNALTQVEETVSDASDDYTLALSEAVQELPTEEVITIYTEPPVQEAAAVAQEVYDYTYDNPDIAASSVVVNAEETSVLSKPVADVTVLEGFSGDTLVYNEIYGDWRTHNGIDIEAELGCSVNAAADGTVTKVTEGSHGKEVVIEHDNGLSTIYAQLGSVNVSEGDSVVSDSVIGTIGEPVGENVKTPHLHYEIHRDNKPVNPEEY